MTDSWGEPRSKTVTWYDPFPGAKAGAAMAGRDYLQAMIDGKLAPPPISGVFNFRLLSVGDGDAVFTCTPDESAYNPIGVVHGGLVCTLLDSAAACAVHSTLPPGVGYTSAEIKINYLRPIHGDIGELTAHGWVTKPGRRIAFAEADVRDSGGKLLATASTTCLIIAPQP